MQLLKTHKATTHRLLHAFAPSSPGYHPPAVWLQKLGTLQDQANVPSS